MRQPLFEGWHLFLLRAPTRTVGDGALGAMADQREDPECRLQAGDRSACLELLGQVAARTDLDEAIRLASPSLARVIDKVRDGDTAGLNHARLRRAALAALRYDLRMRWRPTPFGQFAGVACGHFGLTTKIEWGVGHRTRTYPDMDWLMGLVREWESSPAILAHLRVQAHSALWIRGRRVFLDIPPNVNVSPGGIERGGVSVRHTAPVRDALEIARTPIQHADLLAQLGQRHPDAPESRVSALVASLVAQDLLITNLRPPLDGSDPLDHVLTVLAEVERRLGCGLAEIEAMRRVRSAMADYDAKPLGCGGDSLGRLLGVMREIRRHETPLHVETALDLAVQVPEEVRHEAALAADVMWRLSPPRHGMLPLRPYHQAFLERYGPGRLVGLLDLLREETGLGAPAGYEWPPSSRPGDDPKPTRSATRDRVLADLVARAVRTGAREVVLDDATLEALAFDQADPVDLPSSCELYVHLVAPSAEALDNGEFRIVVSPNPGSHHAGGTFGRFVGLFGEADDEVVEACRALVPRVPGSVPADLVFQPRSARAANIAHTLRHTSCRIAIGLPDVVPGDNGPEEIRLTDIAVTATLDRLLAVHVPTGRELAPVAPHMLSPAAQAPNHARLLWEIGQEGRRMWEPWDWASASPSPFLPRVRYGRIILSSATWKLGLLRPLISDKATDPRKAIQQWREEWRVPRQILVLSTDQRIVIDLDIPWHQELLIEELRRDSNLVAQEVPGGEDGDGWLASDGDHRTAELVIPLVRRPDLPRPAPARFVRVPPDVDRRRRHLPGGEWLFVKLYGSMASQDQILREHLPALLEAVNSIGIARWFFIRYSDPGCHLRLRFHGGPQVLWGQVLPVIVAAVEEWQQQGLVGQLVLDEYDPEWERYGGPAAQAAVERVFEADSSAVITLLTLLRQPGFDYDLQTLAVLCLADLARAFGPPPEGTVGLTDLVAPDDPASLWLAATGPQREVPANFRPRRRQWCDLVDPVGDWPLLATTDAGRMVRQVLETRAEAIAEYGALIRAQSEKPGWSTPPLRIVGSLMHMTCNRLFGGHVDQERDAIALARAAVLANLNRRRHTA